MKFQDNSVFSGRMPAKQIRKRKSFYKDLLKEIFAKAELAFTYFSLFLFTDAITMVVITEGVSEGQFFTFDQFNFTPVRLLNLVQFGITFLLLAYRYKRTIYVLLSNPLLIATISLISLSFLWSVVPGASFQAGLFVFFNMLFSVYLAGQYTLKRQIKMLSYVLLAITILNFVFVYFFPEYGIMGPPVHAGAWRGVFTHKNGAGRMMVLACSVMFTMFHEAKSKHIKLMYLVGLFLAFLMIDKTRSGGALINSWLIFIITIIIQIFKTESRKLSLSLVFIVTTSVFIALAYIPIMTFVLGLVGKDPTFTGRTDIWEYIHTMISNRPALGYGVAGFWHGEEGVSLYVIERAGWRVPDAHHGFLDALLQVGFIGTAMLSLVLWQTFLRALARVRLFKTWVSSWPAVYILYISLVNLSESSLIAPNSIFWILICSMSMTMSFEAKYLVDFDRFNLIDENSRELDKSTRELMLTKSSYTSN